MRRADRAVPPRVFAPPEEPRILPSEKSRITAPWKPIPGLSAQARDPMAVKIALSPSIFAASPIAAQSWMGTRMYLCRAARHPRPGICRLLPSGARGRRRLLRLSRVGQGPPRSGYCRFLGQRSSRHAAHGEPAGVHAGCSPASSEHSEKRLKKPITLA